MPRRTQAPARLRIEPRALFEYLPAGRNRAKTAEVICRHFKITAEHATENQKRHVRAVCEKALRLGYLICSDENGYYKPRHPREVARTAQRFTSQIACMSKRLPFIASNAFGIGGVLNDVI